MVLHSETLPGQARVTSCFHLKKMALEYRNEWWQVMLQHIPDQLMIQAFFIPVRGQIPESDRLVPFYSWINRLQQFRVKRF